MKCLVLLSLIAILCILGSRAYDCKPTVDGKKYDLSPLQRVIGDYVISKSVIGKAWDAILNFCIPVNENVCPIDSAICQVWDYNCPVRDCGAASLGSVNQVSYYLRDGEIVVKFLGGDEGRNSEIRFKCVKGSGVGFPTFINEDPVKQYNFAWSTEYACIDTPVNLNCTLKVAAGRLIDLISARGKNDFYVAPEYSVNICGPLADPCVSNVTNSIACQRLPNVQLSLGKADQYTFSFNEKTSALNITFIGGDAGRMTNYVVLCAKDYEDPFFLNESPTKVYNFIWKNPLVCNSTFVENLINKK